MTNPHDLAVTIVARLLVLIGHGTTVEAVEIVESMLKQGGTDAPPPAPPTWQPIKTAPMNGAQVLVWANRTYCIANRSIVNDEHRGWFSLSAGDWIHPSHWMPLHPPAADAPPPGATPRIEVNEHRSPDGDGHATVVPASARSEHSTSLAQGGGGLDNRGAGSEPADAHTKPSAADVLPALRALVEEIRNTALSHQVCRHKHCDEVSDDMYQWADKIDALIGGVSR